MGASFSKYVHDIARIIVPLLRFYFHEGVREAAASVLPLLIRSLVLAEHSIS
jgi:hypothetical protein